MKHLLRILFFFLLATQICFGQWEWQNPLPTRNTLNDVVLVDENIGWAVGDNGAIIKTANGGIDWDSQESRTTKSLRGVCFIDENIGWAAGDNGIILTTTTGGMDWIEQTSGLTQTLNEVCFVDINNGWIVGSGTILHTTNGGTDWVSQMTFSYSLYGVYFVDANTGWAVGDAGKILRTTNGGLDWMVQLNGPDERWLYDIHFVNLNTGWAVGVQAAWDGIILKTTNSGTTWFPQAVGMNLSYFHLFGVSFADENNGWIVGGDWYSLQTGGSILRTTNGGMEWTEKTLRSQKFSSVHFSNNSVGTLVGESGTILNSTDGGNTWMNPTTGCTIHWYGVSFADANNGTVVGEFGTIMHTINGGDDFNFQTSGVEHGLRDVAFTTANTGTVVGDSGTILKTTNGGTNWIQQTSGTVFPLCAVSFIDENTGWVVGSEWNGGNYETVILKTTNGGSDWIDQSAGITMPLNDVYFVDANIGFIAGGDNYMYSTKGIILKTTDGGDSWNEQITDSATNWHGISFSDALNGIVVGRKVYWLLAVGNIFRTTDGGINWVPAMEVEDVLYSVVINGSNYGWAVGGEYWLTGLIQFTSDGGLTWSKQAGDFPNSLIKVCFINSSVGWIVGDNGTILHTTNGGVVPVELNSFTATANGKEITLNWSTATELNNQGFEVQRKFGSNEFVTVGSVKGHGTTTSPNNYTYVDKLTDAGKYFYRLKQIDFGGKYEYSQTVEVNWSPFTTYKLEQNYPNPFNPTTTIGFGIQASPNPSKGGALVKLKVYDVLGNEVQTLINKEMEAGYHSIDFNASDLPSGVYFYQISAGEFNQTRKMLLLK